MCKGTIKLPSNLWKHLRANSVFLTIQTVLEDAKDLIPSGEPGVNSIAPSEKVETVMVNGESQKLNQPGCVPDILVCTDCV